MIGIICLGDIRYSPYIEKYTDILKNNNSDYEFIFWDRFPQKKIKYDGNNLNIFSYPLSDEVKLTKKIFAFLKFRKYAKKVILQKKYDKLIVLTTLTGIVLFDVLLTKYKKKYVYDYRDASYEYFLGFKTLFKQLAKNSYFTCISSRGFEKILPHGISYIMAHNFRYKDMQYINKDMKPINSKDSINVAFIGNLRDKNYILQLIDIFSKDTRFVLFINGGGENLEEVRAYADKFTNVVCTGAYDNEEKKNYINNAHILCYNYPSSFINDNAIANKYYDSIIYKKPMLGNVETYSGKLIEEKGLGISLKLDEENFTNKLFNYYLNINSSMFLENTSMLLEEVLTEDKRYLQMIYKFVMS